MIESGEKLRNGTNVRVVNFPPPADPKNQFNWNGKIGKIIGATHLGTDVNGWSVYEYDVYFPRVEIPIVKTDAKTGRLLRSSRFDAAQNRFNVAFLELAPADPVVEVPAELKDETRDAI